MATTDHPMPMGAAPPLPSTQVPPSIDSKLRRGRKQMLTDAPKRRLCIRFEKGDTYWYLTSKNTLSFQSTITNPDRSGKPPHRIRNTYNYIRPIIDAKVSASTQRVPSYEVDPATNDPEARGAAQLSEQVAIYGYDQWRLRRATVKTVKNALVTNDGFAMPYWEPNVGPYIQVEDPETGLPKWVGVGDVRVITLNRNQVYWEPGCEYEQSPWFAVERARPIDEVQQIPGCYPVKLSPDAAMSDVPNDGPSENMVIVTEYFERPCPKYPEGRWLIAANGKQICPEQPYPLRDARDRVVDEPLLHRLSWNVDPDSDNDLGLVWQLIDAQRTIHDVVNKMLEWKNRALNPQMVAPIGSLVTPPDDVPGAIRYYKNVLPGQEPHWEQPPAVPDSLFRMYELAVQMIRDLGSDQQPQIDPNVAAKTVTTVIEQTQARWQSFLGDLAEWHSRVMRHCLMLVARYYTEPRTLEIRGRFGTQTIEDFRGAALPSQMRVRVLPDSLGAKTRQQVMNELSWIQANFPGYLSPEVAIGALHGGTAESLIQSYELDVARVDRVINAIRNGTVMDLPTRTEMMPDPATGQVAPMEVPGYMPSEADSLPIWKRRFGDWMKTLDYEGLDPAMQEVANQVWAGINFREQQAQQAAVAQQNAEAAAKGLANAAAPQVKGMPSPPAAQ